MMINSSLCPALISVLLLNVSLGRTEMDKISQYHQSNNSKLEDSLVMTSKTNSYVPLSALCAESTLERIRSFLIKIKTIGETHLTGAATNP